MKNHLSHINLNLTLPRSQEALSQMPMFKCVLSFMILTCYAIFREEVADVGVPISPMHTGGRVFGMSMRKFSANNFLPPPPTYFSPRKSSDSQSSDSFKPRESQEFADQHDTSLLNYPASPSARKQSIEHKQVPSPLAKTAPSANTPPLPSIKVSAAPDKAWTKKMSLELPSTSVDAIIEPKSTVHSKTSVDYHADMHEAVTVKKTGNADSTSKSRPVVESAGGPAQEDDIEDDLIWFELTQKLAELPPEESEAKSPRAAKRSTTLPPKRSSRSAY